MTSNIDIIIMSCSCTKPENKRLKILILGGGPIGLYIGCKMLKMGNNVTIFEKRKKYTRHNILSLGETTEIDTLSLIPSEIIEDLDKNSSFSVLNNHDFDPESIDIDKIKKIKYQIKQKPYLMVSSRVYYIVLNELENAFEKY